MTLCPNSLLKDPKQVRSRCLTFAGTSKRQPRKSRRVFAHDHKSHFKGSPRRSENLRPLAAGLAWLRRRNPRDKDARAKKSRNNAADLPAARAAAHPPHPSHFTRAAHALVHQSASTRRARAIGALQFAEQTTFGWAAGPFLSAAATAGRRLRSRHTSQGWDCCRAMSMSRSLLKGN